ncbi:MAG: hypothetical protein ACI4V1_06890 [Eubacteriales bacterium]
MIFGWGKGSGKGNSQDQNQKIDFSQKTDEQLLDSFKSSNWNALSEENRIGLVQEMENRQAAAQGRIPAEVVSANDPGKYGSYNSTNNRMSLNVSNFSSYEVLDTYAHESNHAYQNHCVKNGLDYDEQTRGMMDVETKRDNNGNLYNYARTSPQYDMQTNELDSNNKAADFVMSEKERFKDDPAFKEYVSERNNHFGRVNENLANHSNLRTSMQNNQLYSAYVRGDISEEQYNRLSANVNDKNYIDPTVEKSNSIGAQLQSLENELNGNSNEAAVSQENTNDAGTPGHSSGHSNDNGRGNDDGKGNATAGPGDNDRGNGSGGTTGGNDNGNSSGGTTGGNDNDGNDNGPDL